MMESMKVKDDKIEDVNVQQIGNKKNKSGDDLNNSFESNSTDPNSSVDAENGIKGEGILDSVVNVSQIKPVNKKVGENSFVILDNSKNELRELFGSVKKEVENAVLGVFKNDGVAEPVFDEIKAQDLEEISFALAPKKESRDFKTLKKRVDDIAKLTKGGSLYEKFVEEYTNHKDEKGRLDWLGYAKSYDMGEQNDVILPKNNGFQNTGENGFAPFLFEVVKGDYKFVLNALEFCVRTEVKNKKITPEKAEIAINSIREHRKVSTDLKIMEACQEACIRYYLDYIRPTYEELEEINVASLRDVENFTEGFSGVKRKLELLELQIKGFDRIAEKLNGKEFPKGDSIVDEIIRCTDSLKQILPKDALNECDKLLEKYRIAKAERKAEEDAKKIMEDESLNRAINEFNVTGNNYISLLATLLESVKNKCNKDYLREAEKRIDEQQVDARHYFGVIRNFVLQDFEDKIKNKFLSYFKDNDRYLGNLGKFERSEVNSNLNSFLGIISNAHEAEKLNAAAFALDPDQRLEELFMLPNKFVAYVYRQELEPLLKVDENIFKQGQSDLETHIDVVNKLSKFIQVYNSNYANIVEHGKVIDKKAIIKAQKDWAKAALHKCITEAENEVEKILSANSNNQLAEVVELVSKEINSYDNITEDISKQGIKINTKIVKQNGQENGRNSNIFDMDNTDEIEYEEIDKPIVDFIIDCDKKVIEKVFAGVGEDNSKFEVKDLLGLIERYKNFRNDLKKKLTQTEDFKKNHPSIVDNIDAILNKNSKGLEIAFESIPKVARKSENNIDKVNTLGQINKELEELGLGESEIAGSILKKAAETFKSVCERELDKLKNKRKEEKQAAVYNIVDELLKQFPVEYKYNESNKNVMDVKGNNFKFVKSCLDSLKWEDRELIYQQSQITENSNGNVAKFFWGAYKHNISEIISANYQFRDGELKTGDDKLKAINKFANSSHGDVNFLVNGDGKSGSLHVVLAIINVYKPSGEELKEMDCKNKYELIVKKYPGVYNLLKRVQAEQLAKLRDHRNHFAMIIAAGDNIHKCGDAVDIIVRLYNENLKDYNDKLDKDALNYMSDIGCFSNLVKYDSLLFKDTRDKLVSLAGKGLYGGDAKDKVKSELKELVEKQTYELINKAGNKSSLIKLYINDFMSYSSEKDYLSFVTNLSKLNMGKMGDESFGISDDDRKLVNDTIISAIASIPNPKKNETDLLIDNKSNKNDPTDVLKIGLKWLEKASADQSILGEKGKGNLVKFANRLFYATARAINSGMKNVNFADLKTVMMCLSNLKDKGFDKNNNSYFQYADSSDEDLSNLFLKIDTNNISFDLDDICNLLNIIPAFKANAKGFFNRFLGFFKGLSEVDEKDAAYRLFKTAINKAAEGNDVKKSIKIFKLLDSKLNADQKSSAARFAKEFARRKNNDLNITGFFDKIASSNEPLETICSYVVDETADNGKGGKGRVYLTKDTIQELVNKSLENKTKISISDAYRIVQLNSYANVEDNSSVNNVENMSKLLSMNWTDDKNNALNDAQKKEIYTYIKDNLSSFLEKDNKISKSAPKKNSSEFLKGGRKISKSVLNFISEASQIEEVEPLSLDHILKLTSRIDGEIDDNSARIIVRRLGELLKSCGGDLAQHLFKERGLKGVKDAKALNEEIFKNLIFKLPSISVYSKDNIEEADREGIREIFTYMSKNYPEDENSVNRFKAYYLGNINVDDFEGNEEEKQKELENRKSELTKLLNGDADNSRGNNKHKLITTANILTEFVRIFCGAVIAHNEKAGHSEKMGFMKTGNLQGLYDVASIEKAVKVDVSGYNKLFNSEAVKKALGTNDDLTLDEENATNGKLTVKVNDSELGRVGNVVGPTVMGAFRSGLERNACDVDRSYDKVGNPFSKCDGLSTWGSNWWDRIKKNDWCIWFKIAGLKLMGSWRKDNLISAYNQFVADTQMYNILLKFLDESNEKVQNVVNKEGKELDDKYINNRYIVYPLMSFCASGAVGFFICLGIKLANDCGVFEALKCAAKIAGISACGGAVAAILVCIGIAIYNNYLDNKKMVLGKDFKTAENEVRKEKNEKRQISVQPEYMANNDKTLVGTALQNFKKFKQNDKGIFVPVDGQEIPLDVQLTDPNVIVAEGKQPNGEKPKVVINNIINVNIEKPKEKLKRNKKVSKVSAKDKKSSVDENIKNNMSNIKNFDDNTKGNSISLNNSFNDFNSEEGIIKQRGSILQDNGNFVPV